MGLEAKRQRKGTKPLDIFSTNITVTRSEGRDWIQTSINEIQRRPHINTIMSLQSQFLKVQQYGSCNKSYLVLSDESR